MRYRYEIQFPPKGKTGLSFYSYVERSSLRAVLAAARKAMTTGDHLWMRSVTLQVVRVALEGEDEQYRTLAGHLVNGEWEKHETAQQRERREERERKAAREAKREEKYRRARRAQAAEAMPAL